jgi:serine O-acetyltransferase
MDEETDKGQCKLDMEAGREFRGELPEVVKRLVRSCDHESCFDHVGPDPIPSRESIIKIIHGIIKILYPGYFVSERLDTLNLEYHLGQEATEVFEALSHQITLSIRHDCLRYQQPCVQCQELGQEKAIGFMRGLPDLRHVLGTDIRAAFEGDPAAKSYDEIIFCYPGVLAITVYRAAHQLYHQEIPLIPRIMTEYAHSHTGIDIHPGAHIGESFFIDHGSGVVIGETTEIGDRVRLYQGVTLGALFLPRDAGETLRQKKRHPTIEDDVIVYSGATILGGNTLIGARSVIGGNVWITESVPPDTRVLLRKPDLMFKEGVQ